MFEIIINIWFNEFDGAFYDECNEEIYDGFMMKYILNFMMEVGMNLVWIKHAF